MTQIYFYDTPHKAGSKGVERETFTCGHCNVYVTGDLLCQTKDNQIKWLYCPSCGKGTTKVGDKQFPGFTPGDILNGLSELVAFAYEEARQCFSVGAFTACELMCRKIIMNVAVDKGADANQRFIEYVNFLENNNIIVSSMKEWVDQIRKHGNDATHEIANVDKNRALVTFTFTERLLDLVYQAPYEFSSLVADAKDE